jgi:hypothetical protein
VAFRSDLFHHARYGDDTTSVDRQRRVFCNDQWQLKAKREANGSVFDGIDTPIRRLDGKNAAVVAVRH